MLVLLKGNLLTAELVACLPVVDVGVLFSHFQTVCMFWACATRGQRSTSDIFLNHFSLVFEKKKPFTRPEAYHSATLANQEAQVLPPQPSTGLTDTHTAERSFLLGCQGLELSSSC